MKPDSKPVRPPEIGRVYGNLVPDDPPTAKEVRDQIDADTVRAFLVMLDDD